MGINLEIVVSKTFPKSMYISSIACKLTIFTVILAFINWKIQLHFYKLEIAKIMIFLPATIQIHNLIFLKKSILQVT